MSFVTASVRMRGFNPLRHCEARQCRSNLGGVGMTLRLPRPALMALSAGLAMTCNVSLPGLSLVPHNIPLKVRGTKGGYDAWNGTTLKGRTTKFGVLHDPVVRGFSLVPNRKACPTLKGRTTKFGVLHNSVVRGFSLVPHDIPLKVRGTKGGYDAWNGTTLKGRTTKFGVLHNSVVRGLSLVPNRKACPTLKGRTTSCSQLIKL
jgi:hypothetical protein